MSPVVYLFVGGVILYLVITGRLAYMIQAIKGIPPGSAQSGTPASPPGVDLPQPGTGIAMAPPTVGNPGPAFTV